MNLPELCIRRPIMTSLLMAGLFIFGVFGYKALSVSELPNVDFPTILVSASLPGASPDTMASSVATPLEKQFSTIAGIDNMSSLNAQGMTQVTVQFSLDRNIDAAAQDIQSAIVGAQKYLPANLPAPPIYQKVNPADQPILFLALSSQILPLSKVDEFAENMMAQKISTISGVAQVQVFGSQKYAVRIQLDPSALASRGIGIDEVAAAIGQGNVNLPTGLLSGAHQAFTVQATGQLTNAADYRRLVVVYRNGSPVRLEELGQVADSVQNDKVASWYNGTRGIVLAIQRQPGTNTVEVAANIKRLLPVFRSQMPPSVKLDILYDRSDSIMASIEDVKFTLYLAIILVVLVIFVFLRKVSATVIPSFALPLSIVGTFSILYLFGYSIDNLSLMALTLSVGFVVDDAIVMLENIVRHLEKGESVETAAFTGSKEIGFTILSMTISLAAVFTPVFFMGGILGRLLHEFSVAIIASILVSGLVSLTLTPMLCSRILREHKIERHGSLYLIIEKGFNAVLHAYESSLKFALAHRALVMALFFVLLAASIFLFKTLPKGFIPNSDAGLIFTFTQGPQDVSFESMKAHQQELAAIFQKNPSVESFMSGIGAGGPNVTGNTGRIFSRLKPRSERPDIDTVIQQLRPQLAAVPGIRAFPQNLPMIRIGGMLTKSMYQYTLQDLDLGELYEWAPKLEGKLRTLPGFQDVTSDLEISTPQINVEIDRDKAASLGVTAQQIEDSLYYAYGSRQVSTIYTSSDQYWVIMELQPEYQRNPNALGLLYIRSNSGQLVPLNSVARMKLGVGPLTIAHMGQLPAVTISFNLKPGVSLSDAVTEVDGATKELGVPMTLTGGFQGVAQAFQASFKGIGFLFVMALLVIYIVLGILYESFIHPITILSGLPSAAFGALATLWLFNLELNIFGFVGLLMLIGIVKKNAIMMIDFAIHAQRVEGKKPYDAIYEGCIIRFRPIMMTTAAALMGTLPIAIGWGSGSDVRRPLGMSVVGGLLISQLVTLYITPVIYLYFESLKTFRSR